jgi:polyhydroxybutyrate depolymerase
MPPPGGTVQLHQGCNNIALSFPDGTPSETVTEAVTPAGSVGAMWHHNAAMNKWEGFSPEAAQASDLRTVDFFIAVWLCIAGAPLPVSGEDFCDPARPHASGTTVETISAPEGTRSYRLHVPPSYTGADPVPLVLDLHGYTSNAIEQQYYSGLWERADQPGGGFVVVIPEGLPEVPGVPDSQHWNHVQFGGLQDDVAFLSDLLDEMEATLCIDPNRIFSTGMSNGGEMSIRLACSLSSRIAAIAPVAGAYYPPFTLTEPPAPWQNSAETCADTRPMPVIAFHGTDDFEVPFEGGLDAGGFDYRLALDNTTPDDDVMQAWAAHNGCTSGRQESTVTSEVRLVTYTGCDDGADVLLYIVDGGGHTWPGSFDLPPLGYTTQDISATDLMLEFFQLHPMPGASEPTPTPTSPPPP